MVSEDDDLEPLSPFKVTRGLALYDNGELTLMILSPIFVNPSLSMFAIQDPESTLLEYRSP